MLSEIEKQTILASIRNGLGLTSACVGLHLDPEKVSEFIRLHPDFSLDCQKQAIAGYVNLLAAMNDAANKKVWDKWKTNRSYIDTFITKVNLWGAFCKASEFSFENFTLAIKHCRTINETATAMGMTETDLWRVIYKDFRLVQWLMQNGFNV